MSEFYRVERGKSIMVRFLEGTWGGFVFGLFDGPCLLATEQKNSFGRFPERKRLFSMWLAIS